MRLYENRLTGAAVGRGPGSHRARNTRVVYKDQVGKGDQL